MYATRREKKVEFPCSRKNVADSSGSPAQDPSLHRPNGNLPLCQERRVGGHFHGDSVSFAALLENFYTNCSKTFDVNSARNSHCHYSSIHFRIKLTSCKQKPYYRSLFRSGRIPIWHDLTFD
ncbi:hypothetical protein TNCV_3010071 [Trichonephila clavipes]|nr:hypothetical protein TNCV_3010071 [Trichonephila clavipes]